MRKPALHRAATGSLGVFGGLSTCGRKDVKTTSAKERAAAELGGVS